MEVSKAQDYDGLDFAYPIEFVLADHDHQRVQFAALERLANDLDAPDARAIAAAILEFLELLAKLLH